MKKSFIVGLSLAIAFYPMAPVLVIADDTVAESALSDAPAKAEPEASPAKESSEEPASEPAESAPKESPAPVSEETPVVEEVAAPTVSDTQVAPVALETPAPENTEASQPSPCDAPSGDGHDGGSTVENCNDATADNNVTAASDTGDNTVVADTVPAPAIDATFETATASADSSGSAIGTGDAGATAAAVNDVNTNIVGTDVAKETVIKDGSDNDDVDLLATFVAGDAEPLDIAAADDVGSGGLTVENGNVADVENTITATAETGDNAIEGGGDAVIGTGDANAVAAAVNIVNTTLVGSNGLLATVNIVGDYVGDIILPGEGLLSFGDGETASLETVENENEATVENTVTASASTGNNIVENSGEATIDTGDAVAVAESETIVNTNFIGNNWLLATVNVFGQWLGGVVDGDDADGDGIIGFFFGGGGEDGGCTAGCGDIVSVFGKNVAYVVNTVTASADTGGNTVIGADDAIIATGNATATAAAFNFVNNNIVGNNWLFAVVNVFGNWGGNLVFAYPDLATSISDGRESALPGETLTYDVRVGNGGKADAERVSVAFAIPDGSEYRFGSDGAERDGNTVVWTLPSLKKGESKRFTVTVSVDSGVSDGTDLRAYSQAQTETTEKYPENNSAEDRTTINIPDAHITGVDADDDPYHTGLRVRRSKPEGTFRGGDTVTHRITVENTGKNDAYDVVVQDSFEAPDGTIIGTPVWLVGAIDAGKGVRIEYTIVIPDQVGAGQYRYTAKAEGRQRDDEKIRSKKAYAMLNIAGSAFASALGAETVEAAPPEDLSIPGEVRGAEAATIADIADRKTLPLWMLLLSGLAYALMLNWSFFPSVQKRIIRI